LHKVSDKLFYPFYEFIFQSFLSIKEYNQLQISLKFIQLIPDDLDIYPKYFNLIFNTVFKTFSSSNQNIKIKLFSDFFSSTSSYIKTNSSIMKSILNSQIFIDYLKGLSGNLSCKSQSFQDCFKYFHSTKYEISEEIYQIIITNHLIDQILYENKLVELILKYINDIHIIYSIEQRS
jgi:phage-related holin